MSEDIRVLYMEDDLGLAKLLQKSLERNGGFRVDVAYSGEEGIGRFGTHKYDVVLVDQNMPGCSGLEVIRAISSKSFAPPIIMVTSSTSANVATEAMKYGAKDFVCKDTDGTYLENLPRMIRRVIEKEKGQKDKVALAIQTKDSDDRYRKLVEASPDGIAILTNEKFMFINPAGVKILGGRSPEEILGTGSFEGKTFSGFLISEDRTKAISFLRRAKTPSLSFSTGLSSTKIDSPWEEFTINRLDAVATTLEVAGVGVNFEGREGVQIVFRDITFRKKQEASLQADAKLDSLTGVANRSAFFADLDQACKSAMRQRQKFAVVVVGLDKFKEVNTSCGYSGGDVVLKEIAKRLMSSVKAGDTVARLGGDEFAVVLNNIQGADDVSATAGRILALLGRSILVNGRGINVTASLGISLYPESLSAQELLGHADEAMSLAKGKGRNQCHFHPRSIRGESKPEGFLWAAADR